MFPLHAKCVTFDAGYDMERKEAREKLKLGRVYTIRSMTVDRSRSTMEFYEVEGKWNTVFFDAAPPIALSFEQTCEDAGLYELPNHGRCDCPPDTRGDACNGTCKKKKAQ
jgi:hypothetical protein